MIEVTGLPHDREEKEQTGDKDGPRLTLYMGTQEKRLLRVSRKPYLRQNGDST
jgi:hypothetical protein